MGYLLQRCNLNKNNFLTAAQRERFLEKKKQKQKHLSDYDADVPGVHKEGIIAVIANIWWSRTDDNMLRSMHQFVHSSAQEPSFPH